MASIPAITKGQLLTLVLDMTARRTVNSILSTTPRIGTLVFTRGDTLKGTITTVQQSGSLNPVYWIVNIPTYNIALTNGADFVYATAAGWEALGGVADPRQVFDLDVSGAPLDAALHQTSGSSISAFLEIQIASFPVGEGSAYPQDQYIIREPATIFKTALNPLP
jgi:hypothetical protein